VRCGFSEPEACDDCPDNDYVEIDMPATLVEPGLHDVATEDIVVDCRHVLTSCPAMDIGGEEGAPVDDLVEIVAIEPGCVAIIEPCLLAGVILAPACP
jgi:hypothetical protein